MVENKVGVSEREFAKRLEDKTEKLRLLKEMLTTVESRLNEHLPRFRPSSTVGKIYIYFPIFELDGIYF